MQMAVASDGLQVSSHAVHCSSFMFYTVKRGIITECQNLPNPGLPANETVGLLKNLEIDVLITGGIDMDFANMLCHSGIEVMAGVSGQHAKWPKLTLATRSLAQPPFAMREISRRKRKTGATGNIPKKTAR